MDCALPLKTDLDRIRPARPGGDCTFAAVAALALLATLAASPPAATAASHRLSQGLPFSDVNGWELSPDGQFAVYLHDAELDDTRELWSVRVAGGAPVRLSNPLPAGVSVQYPFEISPDSQRVVYLVAQETTGQVELYSIPIAGPEGAWIKLNGELPADGDVFNPVISPDSARVIYVAHHPTTGATDAWTVPIDGGTPIRLRPFLTLAGSQVLAAPNHVVISPDSERAVFFANFSNLAYFDLWSARTDGTGGFVQLTETTADLTDVTYPGISPDSSRVLYLRRLPDTTTHELYSVPLAGGNAVKLNGALTPGGSAFDFQFSPDSSRVIYRADQQTDDVVELYSVPLAGGGATKLNDVLPVWGGLDSYAISPDGARVVYSAIRDVAGVIELFSVPLAGGAVTKLNPALPTGRAVSFLAIAPDSSRVVYLADQRLNDVQEVFSVPLAGGASVRVSDDPVVGGDVTEFAIAPGSDFVFYCGDLLTNGVPELFRGRIAGLSGADDRVSGAMVSGGEVGQASWAVLPDGLQVVYTADQEVDQQIDLYLGDLCLLCDAFEAGDSGRWD